MLSDEFLTVDGTLVEAWAGQKSFQKKGSKISPPPDDPGNPTVDFKGEKWTNAAHVLTTVPDARLYRMLFGTGSNLCCEGNVLNESRHGLAARGRVAQATSHAELDAAIEMLAKMPISCRATMGGDKAYDVRGFVDMLRFIKVPPCIVSTVRCGALGGRTTRHAGYAVNQRKRMLAEQIFGWMKTVGMMRKMRYRGTARFGWNFVFTLAAYNLIRLRMRQVAPP